MSAEDAFRMEPMLQNVARFKRYNGQSWGDWTVTIKQAHYEQLRDLLETYHNHGHILPQYQPAAIRCFVASVGVNDAECYLEYFPWAWSRRLPADYETVVDLSSALPTSESKAEQS